MGVDRNTWQIPGQTITDWPRFAWRGAMLDVARHFFTVREVEQYIDLLALYKLNVLHLHLSDDQGWRIQLNSRPRLTELGSLTQVGGGPGGFFTQQDYQNIIRYAAARYVLIVPEIDMPSHINSGVIAYPDLACGSRPPGLYTGTDVGWSSLCVDKEATYAFVDDVASLRVDPDVDFARTLLRRLGIGLRQRDLQLGDPLIGRRHHQEDQNDEQHVDQRNEVDLRIVARTHAA